MNAWLLDLALLTTVLLAAALLLRFILSDPKSRVLLAWWTWLGIAAAALVTILPGWPRYDLRALGWPATTQQPEILQGAPVQPLPVAADWAFPTETGPTDHSSPPMMPPNMTLGELAILTWLSAALLGLAWIALGAWQARRLLRRSQPAPNWLQAELAQICTSDTIKNISLRPPSHKHSTATASAFHPYKSVSIRGSISSPFRAFSCFLWPFRPVSHTLGRVVRTVLSMFPATSDGSPDLRIAPHLSSAVALRAHKPAILLPHASTDPSNAKTVRAALAHEWAHIRHGDLWLLALERLLLPLLALHPLFWLLRKSTRLDQELLADAAAAADQPVEYAEAILAWAKTSAPPPAALAALAFWDRPSNLTRRVHMILHKPRPTSTWLNRLLSLAALSFLLTLVAGLSLVTLQPLAAEDEPTKATPATERPVELPRESPLATQRAQAIELDCTILEVERARLAQVLAEGEHPPLPSPAIELGLQTAEKWKETLAVLQANPDVHSISRPRLITHNKRRAGITMGVQPEGQKQSLGLKLELLPELLPMIGKEQQLLLSIAVERPAMEESNADSGSPRFPMTRKVQTKVAVPLGKVVVFADPSNRSPQSSRQMLVAVEPKLVIASTEPARNQKTSGSQPPLAALARELEEATQRLNERATAAHPTPLREQAGVRDALLRLQREIAALLYKLAEDDIEPETALRRLHLDLAGELPSPQAIKEFQKQVNEQGRAAALKTEVDRLLAGQQSAGPVESNRAAPPAQNKPSAEVNRAFQNLAAPRNPSAALAAGPTAQELRVFKARPENAKELAERLTRGLLEFDLAEGSRVSPDAESGAIIVQAEPRVLDFAQQFLAALSEQPNPTPAKASTNGHPAGAERPQLERRLMELDLREAELGLEGVRIEYAGVEQLRKKNLVSESELHQARLKVDLAQVQVERMKVRLEAFQIANPPPTPASPRR